MWDSDKVELLWEKMHKEITSLQRAEALTLLQYLNTTVGMDTVQGNKEHAGLLADSMRERVRDTIDRIEDYNRYPGRNNNKYRQDDEDGQGS